MSLFDHFSRRSFCVGLLGVALAPLFKVRSVLALPDKLIPLIREATGGIEPQAGRVKLTLPPLAESGNSVACKVQVESPMTQESHVTSIHLLSEKNPRPVIARFYLGPRSGRAEINTRIRLGASQQVVALAVMNDGSCWTGTADVVVTAAACGLESKDG
ncbi:MAG: sulfur oxidation protein SoxY [Deltaproteobacteria bacterium]|nr:sulfur oxidation protein SoxY [Deltaproteobacteria bacterium]